MRNIRTWLLALCLTGLAFGVAAQEVYLAGGGGRSSWNFDCPSGSGSGNCERGSASWRAAAGIRFNRVIALEGFYSDFGRARSSSFDLEGTLAGTAAGVQALAGWQFGAFDLAGKLGLATVRSDFRAAPTSFYASERARHSELIGGLMGAVRVTPELAIRLDLDIVTVALQSDAIYYSRGADVVTVTLGAMFRF